MELPVNRRRRVLDVSFDVTDYEGALDSIDSMIEMRRPGYICHVAVNALLNTRRMPSAAAAVAAATRTLPDGMPIVWALRALGENISDRVYGPDLMLAACARAEETGHRHFFYGGRDEAATAALVTALRERFPRLSISGSWTPPFRALSGDERRGVARLIDESGTDIVWVGTGSPRQEIWMHEMRPLLDAPVLIGVGAAFDFHANLVRQAPRWMQQHGLEWLFRLSREPRRLFPRYARDNPLFVAAFARQWFTERVLRR